MISQTAEYALRAVTFLALDSGRAHNVEEIAAATKSPAGYLSKILRQLGRAGLVRGQRGLHGGFTLAVPAEQISVFDVIEAVDPVRRIETCPLDLPQHCDRLCPLHQRLDDAMASMEAAFRKSTIAEVIGDPTEKSIPLGFARSPAN